MADNNKLPYSNRAIAVGTLATLEMIEGEAKESGRKFQYLQGEVQVGDDKIRFTLWPSQKRPSIHLDTQKQFQVGDRVSVNGTLEEQVSQDERLFRGIRAFGVGAADSADREDRLVYHVAGHLGELEKTADEQYVIPITIVRQYKDAQGEDQEREDTIRVHPPTDWLKPIYEKVSKGALVRARGDIINQISIDRYGVASGFKAELTVVLFEVYDEATKLWRVFLQGNAPAAAAQTPKAVAPQQPSAPAKPPAALTRSPATVGASKAGAPAPATQPADDAEVPF